MRPSNIKFEPNNTDVDITDFGNNEQNIYESSDSNFSVARDNSLQSIPDIVNNRPSRNVSIPKRFNDYILY